jgi:hypothetical protein
MLIFLNQKAIMRFFVPVIVIASLFSCKLKSNQEPPLSPQALPIVGTWKLVTGTLVQGKDTTVTKYDSGISFIKIINPTHFSFLQHSLAASKDSTKQFTAGGGTYMLKGDQYTEHLEYCIDRQWEGHDFTFTIHLAGDTLVQEGREKIEGTTIDRFNTERYVRMK